MAGAVANDGRVIDSESLVLLLKRTGTQKRDAFFWHYPHYWSDPNPHIIARSGDRKLLTRHYEGPAFGPYNIALEAQCRAVDARK